ncbi:lysis protein [Escherichia coli]|uniref:lysis protein n=1 Tax=Escherichia coli TaxID=562 RepID=UPI003D3006CE
MTSLKTSIKTITYLSDIGCLEIQGASLVAAGRRRLHIKAVCQSVREATTASGVDNAASSRLADTAERDYFTLRERLVMMQAQLEGAQQYITEQCLK